MKRELPSFRHRYAIVVAVLVTVLLLTAALAYRYSVSVGQRASEQSAWREIATVVLNDSFTALGHTRRMLQELILRPSAETRAGLHEAHVGLGDAVTRLLDHLAREDTPTLTTIGETLRDDAGELRKLSRQLVDIRNDPDAWFPPNRLIEEEMNPRYTVALDIIEWMIDYIGGNSDASQLRPLYELRRDWLRMSGEARLLIADRFGAHAQAPSAGMAARFADMQQYAQLIDDRMRSLDARAQETPPDPLFEIQLAELREAFLGWQEAAGTLYAKLQSESWRGDVTYLRNHVDPLIARIQQQLDDLRLKLHAQARAQVDALSRIGNNLISTLFATFAVMALFSVLAYLSLDRLILHPIRMLTDRLKNDSVSGAAALPESARVRETHDLISAFARMQDLVRERERTLDHMAHHDPLTGLPNRALLRRKLAEAIRAAQDNRMLVGLLFIDLDRFKQVNDSHGHAAGDEMLIQISERLVRVFRQDDLVARLGGDEFAVLLENLHERDEMTRLADKALGVIGRPYEIAGKLFYSGASIGIAVAPDNGTDPDRLLQQADTAMYAAKRDADTSYRFVSDELTIGAAQQHAMENELREAIDAQRLELYFQPIRRVSDGTIGHYEALLRWPHDRQGLLHPETFMDALADAGLCTRASDWVLDQLQRKRPDEDAVISINLSARLLHDEAFARRLFSRLDTGLLGAERLVIEITEDTLETDLRAASRVLHELKHRGVKIALDDFGTGRSSLAHLRHFPFDYLKIDQSFVAGIGRDQGDEKLIQAVIRLAHALDMKIVAEGVETEHQHDFLAAEGCDYLQGYLVGKPAAS